MTTGIVVKGHYPNAKMTSRGIGPCSQCAMARQAGTTGGDVTSGLIDRPDQVLDLLGVRAEFLGKLVEIGVRNGDEA